jgi:predicted DNA-binding transcriptional regulator YafY
VSGLSRSTRLLDLIQVLRRHRRPVTAASLAAEIAVSERTIYRDIATLVGQGAPIAGAVQIGRAGLAAAAKPVICRKLGAK